MKIITSQTTKDNALMKDLQRRGQADTRITESLAIESEIDKESNPLLRNAKRRRAEDRRAKKELRK